MPTASKFLHPRLQFAVSAGLLLFLLFLIWTAGHEGFSSLLSTYAARTNRLAAADAAVRLNPNDPDSHYARATILEAGDLPAAVAEYETAAHLRPDDYVLWLGLARALELDGDRSGAIYAASRAVPLAPYYAQPHWQLGNLLVRAGRRDEGFAELRLAGLSNPDLLPGIIDLAWQLSAGDVPAIKREINPQTPAAYKALAEYFKRHDKTAEAIEMFRAAGTGADSERQTFLRDLIAAKHFPAAYELWLATHPTESANIFGALRNPGFEQDSNLDEPGFDWRAENKTQTITLSLDNANPKEGQSSLRIDFKGDSAPGSPIVSQLVLVEPRVHYQLHFAARMENIVSGGLPQITIADASSNAFLGQPVLLPQEARNWQDHQIDFTVGDTTTAVKISLQRDHCSKSPCPIFGRVWLDNFAMKKMERGLE